MDREVRKHNSQSEMKNYKKDTVENLFEFRNRMIEKISSCKSEIDEKQAMLDECNDLICGLAGHNYNEWQEFNEKGQYLEMNYCYKRTCRICGYIDVQTDIPADYKTKNIKIKTR